MKTDLNELLKAKAGLPGVPPNQNPDWENLKGVTTTMPGSLGETSDLPYSEHKTDPDYIDPVAERPGEMGQYKDLDLKRGGEAGQYQGLELKRGGTRYKLEDLNLTRGGTISEPQDFKVERSGKPGRKYRIETERPGEFGRFDPPDIKRGGDYGTTKPPEIVRPGQSGSTSDINISRPGEMGITSDNDVVRPGQLGSIDPPVINRPGEMGTTSDNDVVRPGQLGTTNPPDINRPGELGSVSDEVRVGLPKNQNPNWVENDGKGVATVSDFIQRYSKLASQVSGWSGVAGFDLPDVGNINGLLQSLGLGDHANLLTNVSKNDLIDLQGYFKHLMQNDWSYGRVALDIGLREWLKFQNAKTSEKREALYNQYKDGDLKSSDIRRRAGILDNNKRVLYETGGTLNSAIGVDGVKTLQTKVIKKPTDQGPASKKQEILVETNPENYIKVNSFTPIENYLGYVPKEGEGLVLLPGLVSNVLNKTGFNDQGYLTDLAVDINDARNFYSGNYNWWRNFEMSDDMYWGVRITPFNSSPIISMLPEFPEEFNWGWWPVISCSFTKNSLKSKTFQFPFFALTIPYQSERPSKLKLEVLDNNRKAIRYWLEQYVEECFDLDNNTVLPYKNICWDITVYRYDMTLSTMYAKRLICLLSEFNCAFNGSSVHVSDEIDLNFEIVGEYMKANKDTKVKYKSNIK